MEKRVRRRIRCAPAMFVLAVMVFFGCTKTDPQPRPGRPADLMTPGAVSTSATPGPTATPTPSPSPTPTPIRSRDDYSLEELYEKIDDTVYRLPVSEYLKNGYVADIDINNDFVCVEFFGNGQLLQDGSRESVQRFLLFHLGVPDIVRIRDNTDGIWGSLHLLEDGTVVIPLVDNVILELDMDLQEIRRFAVPGGSLLGITDDHDLWFKTQNDDGSFFLERYSFEGEKQLSFPYEDYEIRAFLRSDGDNAVFSAFRADFTEYQLRLDLQKGKLAPVDGIHLEQECFADMLEYSTDSKWMFGGLDQSGPVYSFDKKDSSEVMEDLKNGIGATSQWVFGDDNDQPLVYYRVYDINECTLLGELRSDSYESYGFYGQSHLTKRGYVILDVSCGEGDEELILWDVTAETPQKASGSRVITADEETLKLRERAEQIREKYGVRMYFEEVDMAGGMFNSYALIPCDDYYRLSELMGMFEESISGFPDGFWTDLLADGTKKCVRFFLCDGFQRTDLSGIERAAALTSTAYEDICMAYGSKYMNQFPETFVHETMHMMEIRIRKYCTDNHLDFETYWTEELNSSKYGYHDAYTDDSGKDLNDNGGTYTKDPKNAWFIDAYSRTTVREDRARVLENLYLGNNYYFKKSEHLRLKAQHLCAIIRAAFPSVGRSESAMRWESYIGVLDPAEYIELYRVDDGYKDDIDQSETEE